MNNNPLTVSDTWKFILKYDLIAALPCSAAAILAAIPFYMITLTAPDKTYVSYIPKISAKAAVIALIITAASAAIQKKLVRRFLPAAASLYPNALKYAEMQLSRLNKKTSFILPVLLLIAGIVFPICLSCSAIPQTTPIEGYITELCSSGLSVFIASHMHLKKRYLMQTEFIAVPDNDHADRYSRKKNCAPK